MLGHFTYLGWLLGCIGPVLAAQWIGWHRVLRKEARAVFGAAGAVGAYLSLVDGWAIHDGVWEFDRALILGVRFGPVPLEEVLFFLTTSLLVTQSMSLFDARRRAKQPPRAL